MADDAGVREAVIAEAHHYAHLARELVTEGIQRTGRPANLELVVQAAFLDGLEVGARLAIADIVCARRLLPILETEAPTPGDGPRASAETAGRLLGGLSG